MSELRQEASGAVDAVIADDFSMLLQKEFRPTSDDRRSRIEESVRTLAHYALADARLIGQDAYATLDAIKAEIDRKLTEQINKVLHHSEFQSLEAAWRGLHYMVFNSETGTDLKIRVMNVSKGEIGKMFRQYRGAAWDQSPLFKRVYEDGFGLLKGDPYGALVCDYYFDQSGPDVDILSGLSKIGAAAHCPVIAGASPQTLGMSSWTELSRPRDLAKIFEASDYAAWRSLREATDSRYLVLTLPRFLGRRPYGAKGEPVETFAFEEDMGAGDHDRYCWLNAAYAQAVRIGESFKNYGWCTRIRGVESGGTVTSLPTAMFPTDDGGVEVKCPTEIAISDRREAELSRAGFIALLHQKGTDKATFMGAQTVHKPAQFTDDAATANANLSARLPYIFASSRFAHYVKCIVRARIGGSPTPVQLNKELSQWVSQYIDMQPDSSTEEQKARRPLKAAQIEIVPDPENPGYYSGKFSFLPHYQLEGMTVAISMVSRMPAKA